MNYAGVKYCDIANGTGCRTVLFVSGCRNACKGCFQPETWAFDYGEVFDEAMEEALLESLKPDYVKGITILGGEPFEEENQRALCPFIERVHREYPDKDIWMYSGYVYDRDLVPGGRKYTEVTDRILDLVDVLVDGPFVLEEKDLRIKFRGSRNQRILDMKATRAEGTVVLHELN